MLDPRLAAAIAENFGVNVTEITPESSAGDLPGWDSVGHITLILSIEEEFGIRFPADEILSEIVHDGRIIRAEVQRFSIFLDCFRPFALVVERLGQHGMAHSVSGVELQCARNLFRRRRIIPLSKLFEGLAAPQFEIVAANPKSTVSREGPDQQ